MALVEASADKLILIDPTTGAPLPRWRTWLAILVMLSGTTFVALVVTAVAPVMHDISEYFGQGGHGKLVAYGVATVPSVGIMIGAPVTGWIIERTGSRAFLLVILVVFGLAGSAGLYLDNVMALVATRFVLGVSAAGVVTGTLIMITEYSSPEMRARLFGFQGAVGAIAALIIILSSGVLADWGGWRAPFLMYLVAFVVFAATLAIPKRPPPERRPARTVASGQDGLLIALAPALAIIVALFIGSFMPTLQVSFLLAANGVLKASNQSLVIAASAVMVAVGSASYGLVRSRLDDKATLRLCALSLGAGIIVMGLSSGAAIVALGCAISGIGTGLLNPQVNNMLISRVGPDARGRAAGLGYTARYGGDFLNPVIIGPMSAAIGIHAALIVTGAAFIVAALVHLAFRFRASAPT